MLTQSEEGVPAKKLLFEDLANVLSSDHYKRLVDAYKLDPKKPLTDTILVHDKLTGLARETNILERLMYDKKRDGGNCEMTHLVLKTAAQSSKLSQSELTLEVSSRTKAISMLHLSQEEYVTLIKVILDLGWDLDSTYKGAFLLSSPIFYADGDTFHLFAPRTSLSAINMFKGTLLDSLLFYNLVEDGMSGPIFVFEELMELKIDASKKLEDLSYSVEVGGFEECRLSFKPNSLLCAFSEYISEIYPYYTNEELNALDLTNILQTEINSGRDAKNTATMTADISNNHQRLCETFKLTLSYLDESRV